MRGTMRAAKWPVLHRKYAATPLAPRLAALPRSARSALPPRAVPTARCAPVATTRTFASGKRVLHRHGLGVLFATIVLTLEWIILDLVGAAAAAIVCAARTYERREHARRKGTKRHVQA
mmetsp:Transcript_12379/g.32361  ORF Transcript_12379/g.32361 Transcript_12379/m.32361 type:complete len:119 (-) Transcript_12379:547-903(-)